MFSYPDKEWRREIPSILTHISMLPLKFCKWTTLVKENRTRQCVEFKNAEFIPPMCTTSKTSPQDNPTRQRHITWLPIRYEFWCCFRHTCSFPTTDVGTAVCAGIPPSLTQQTQDLFPTQVWKFGVKAKTKNSFLCDPKRENMLTNSSSMYLQQFCF